ncbi:MAG: hypothetical protein IKS90_01145 [Clostridia bacterium]|nr:hypothetical protein [Clostridia bacterium]
MKCPYCGSERIEEGVSFGKVNDNGAMGLKFTRGTLWTGISPVYADLCLDCKAIIKIYIKDDTDKTWSHDPGSMFGR